jgi:hypothetical protein
VQTADLLQFFNTRVTGSGAHSPEAICDRFAAWDVTASVPKAVTVALEFRVIHPVVFSGMAQSWSVKELRARLCFRLRRRYGVGSTRGGRLDNPQAD